MFKTMRTDGRRRYVMDSEHRSSLRAVVALLSVVMSGVAIASELRPIAKIGDARFRHGECVHLVASTGDFRALATCGGAAYDLNDLPRKLEFAIRKARRTGLRRDVAVALWDGETGRCIRRFNAHAVGISAMSFSASGELLLTAGHDGRVCVWHVPGARQVWEKRIENDSILCASFTHDDSGVVVGTLNGHIDCFDAKTGKRLITVDCKLGAVHQITASDLRRVGVVAIDGNNWNCHLIDLPVKKATRLAGGKAGALHAAFSPDARNLAVHELGKHLRILATETGRVVAQSKDELVKPRNMRFSKDGTRLALLGESELLLVETNMSLRPKSVAVETDGGPLEVSNDGERFAIAKGLRLIVGRIDGDPDVASSAHTHAVESVSIAGNGKICATSDAEHIHVWELPSGKSLARIDVPYDFSLKKRICKQVQFSDDAKSLIAVSGENRTRALFFNVEADTLDSSIEIPSCTSFGLSDDGVIFAALLRSGFVFKHRFDSSTSTTHKLPGRIRIGAVASNGSTIATVNHESILTIWDVGNAKIHRRTKFEPDQFATMMSVSGNGELIAYSFQDTSASPRRSRVVAVRLAGEPLEIAGFEEDVSSIAVNTSGSRIAVGTVNGTVTIYSTDDKVDSAVLKEHTDSVTLLTFGRDLLLSFDRTGAGFVWDLGPPSP